MIKPLFDNVVLELEKKEQKTASGIIVSSKEEKTGNIGYVKAIGTGKMVDGKLVPMTVKVGDKVIFRQYAGTEIEVDNQKYTIIQEEDILAILQEGNNE
ncbi:MAG: co-chaperone GroES [Acholeplasmataceae bacterium]|mgnify:CR=1 FL=1|nr:co-chaperone GroES [Acholeplasmataceae bacterium]HOA63348.1 co-chaperone GroES [Bacilli bacterium]HPT89577.1 co-chaperone GroES [Bacilli bacterium]HQA19563.1 co-chaperone GroES [Bacilli bacterium]HQD92432.1 co-chaperone GroES [Bacilli bacterium]